MTERLEVVWERWEGHGMERAWVTIGPEGVFADSDLLTPDNVRAHFRVRCDAQRFQATQREVAAPHELFVGHTEPLEAAQDRRERDGHLETRERRADTEMDAGAEREMARLAALHIEHVRVVKLIGVPVRGAEHQQ